MRILKIEYLILIVIVFGALAVRLYKINSPIADWHSWRQADTASVARLFVEDGVDLLHPRYHDISSVASGFNNPEGWRYVEFPIYNALHALFYENFPQLSFDAWGRLTSVLASLGSLIFIFLVGSRFLGRWGGMLSAFFFAFLPFNIYFSRVVLPEPMAVLFTVASIWFFVLWIDKERLWQLLVSAILFSLALLVKPYTAFYAIPLLYLAFEKFGTWGLVTNFRLWIFTSLSLIPLLVWRGYMNQYLEGIPFWLWTFNGDLIRFKPSWWWWIFEERIGRLILGTWGVFLFVLGFLQKSKNYPWFFHFMFLGQFLYFATIATANVRHDYYQTLSIPTVCFVLAGGIVFLLNIKSGDIALRRFAVLGVIFLAFVFSFYQIKEFYKINHPEIIIAGNAADRLLPKGAKVIAPYTGDTAFLYQTRRIGWPHATLPIDQMVKRLRAEYYVSVNLDEQTKMVMEQYEVIEQTQEYVIVKLR